MRYSKKRTAVLDVIRSTTTHPSADWVYTQLREEYPDISLGTVYRNIHFFKEAGMIISVGTVNGEERLDGNTKPHSHFICNVCGRIIDLFGLEDTEADLDRRIGHLLDADIDHHNLVFHGKCSACR